MSDPQRRFYSDCDKMERLILFLKRLKPQARRNLFLLVLKSGNLSWLTLSDMG